MEKQNKTLWIVGAVIVGVILIIIIYNGATKSNAPTCNSPYILVGNSCCLDQNHNNICDNDEQQVADTQPTGPICGDGTCNGNEKAPDCSDCKISIRIENLKYEILKPAGQYKEFYISNYDIIQLGDRAVLYPGHDLYTGYSQQQCSDKNLMSKIQSDFDCSGGCYFVLDSDKIGTHYYYMDQHIGFQIESPSHENPLCMYFVFHLKPYPESGIGMSMNPAPVATWESPIINV